MKKILGLDLGTNSIGWAVLSAIETEDGKLKPQKIEGTGSRIIPMDAEEMGKFNSGTSVSKTKGRTDARGVRCLRERNLQRRERLHRVLNVLGFLPEHYANQIGFDKAEPKYLGKFLDDKEPKLAWQEILREDGKHFVFMFMDSFNEMLADFAEHQPDLVANGKRIPLDWTIYYMRKKALTQKITKEELAWILLNFNQKRGYYQLRGEDEETKDKNQFVTELKVIEIIKGEVDKKNDKRTWYTIKLENGWKYSATFTTEPNWLNQTKEFLITEELDQDGKIKIVKDKKTDNTGKEKRHITVLPSFEEINVMNREEQDKIFKKIKAKTEITIEKSGETVGSYIYNFLLQKPSQKIRGKLIRTIERKFYRKELEQILQKQSEFHAELKDKSLFEKCIKELYENNENHRNNIANYSFVDLFIKDILFYQRPLKSQKSLISNCPFEVRYFKGKDKNGVETIIKQPLKCIAKSNPLFQEFRLWKFVANLKVYEREKSIDGKLQTDVDVTNDFLKTEDDYVALFEWLNDRKEVKQEMLLEYFIKQIPLVEQIRKAADKKKEVEKRVSQYRWNYVEDKVYPCNKTRSAILLKLSKDEKKLLTKDLENKIWHLLYSVTTQEEIDNVFKDKGQSKGIYVELKKLFLEETIKSLKNTKFEEKEYGSFSEKAIKKLLPLIRMGKYWSEQAIDAKTKERIDKIISGEFDEKIRNRVREKAISLTEIAHFKALPEWLASYIVYDRFSEAKEITKWEKVEDLEQYINSFKQHSLRNPIVEQVILETLRTVRDIWENIQKNGGQIAEIHVELGREMKNDKKQREKLTKMVIENENTNLRIKAMLMEFKNGEYQIDGVIPHSPTQQEILKIYEEYAIGNLNKDDSEFEFISKIAKMSQPTKSEIIRYKLWLEQKYRSPYTGEMIPLGKLFTPDYEIEHIIPQSRYFDDSYSNKVICEAVVNKNPYKDNQLGYEFIKNNEGRIVSELSTPNKTVKIFTKTEYEKFVKDHYSSLKGKMKKLLMDDIPEKFIERQLNDTRYISKKIKCLLSNIVREKLENGEYEQESTSKNLIPITGSITSILKQDWGINEQWNKLILPRFERLNEMTKTHEDKTDKFIAFNKEGHKMPTVPFELQKGFSSKRIDHRHHAMDAVVIACATSSHVNYLNNQSANDEKKRYDLKHTLCFKSKTDEQGNYKWVFHKPWDTFPQDVKSALDEIIVSFKQNLRVINKSVNYHQKFDDKGKKQQVKQTKGDSWAIRKPMHKDTVFGEVNLRKIKEVSLNIALENPKPIVEKELKAKIIELKNNSLDAKKIKKYFEDNKDIWSDINLSKIKVYYFTKDIKDNNGQVKERFFATRKPLDTSFDKEKITKEITDTSIQKILLKHLEQKDNNPELAFSPEGIEEMNRNIKVLNNGKNHQPILKVRWYEKADKFAVGQTGKKKDKFVEAAKGTNLFFAVYQKETYNESEGKTEYSRNYATIPLNEVINRQKQGLSSAPETNENGDRLLFILSPNDLVYLPTKDELQHGVDKEKLDKKRIYKVNDFNDGTIYFTPNTFAKAIKAKEIDTSFDLKTASLDGVQLKEICIPIKVDRLGNIIEINGRQAGKNYLRGSMKLTK